MKTSVKFLWVTLTVGFVLLLYMATQDQFGKIMQDTTTVASDLPWTQQPYVRRHLEIPSFRYLLYPPFPCGAGESPLLGTFVSSAVANSVQRNTIRETWGRPLMGIQKPQQGLRNDTFLFFVIGRTDNQMLQELLVQEEANYSDIIQEDFQDTYLNLTIKSVMILRWVTTFCPRIQFVLKTDDDMFINSELLLAELESRSPKQELLLGKLISKASPIRTNKSKWYAPSSSFDGKVYPNYLSGTGYVMSGDVADRLYSKVDQVPLFHLEDVYITGLLAAEAGIKPVNHGGFKWYKKEAKPCKYKDYLTFHQVSPYDIRTMWNDVHNKSLVCTKKS